MTTIDSPAPEMKPASGEASAPAEVMPSLAWKDRAWAWLEIVGRRVGLPSLVIALVSLCLSSASLYFVVKNYQVIVAKAASDTRHKEIREQLGKFIAEGVQLSSHCSDNSWPTNWPQVNEWVRRTQGYLTDRLDSSYASRLVSAAGVPVNVSCQGADQDHDRLFRFVNAINFHLEQFSSEAASWP
jgi:hypothetical protein